MEANSALALYAVDAIGLHEVRGIIWRQFFPKEILFVRKVMPCPFTLMGHNIKIREQKKNNKWVRKGLIISRDQVTSWYRCYLSGVRKGFYMGTLLGRAF